MLFGKRDTRSPIAIKREADALITIRRNATDDLMRAKAAAAYMALYWALGDTWKVSDMIDPFHQAREAAGATQKSKGRKRSK